MNKLFRPKCLRRVLLCLALLFPIVYLCGSLFFALAGSHGNYDWHENTLVNHDYDEAMETENFKYSDWDWNNEHGTRLGFSLGYVDLNENVNQFGNEFNIEFVPSNTGIIAFKIMYNSGLGFPTQNQYYVDLYLDEDKFIRDDGFDLGIDNYFCMYTIDTSNNYVYVLIFSYTTGILYYSYENNTFVSYDFYQQDLDGARKWYFDDGANLPQGIEWTDELRSYFVPTLKPIESNSLSNYIFSQPFESDNFITSLGRDLIDGSTKGFAPMNDLFRFINSNMLHFESTDGLAMFGLGYVYYAVNVLIIYEILILAVKLIMLPLRAVEIFNRSEDL